VNAEALMIASGQNVKLNWLITQRNAFPIPGAKNEQQARQNAGALGWEMTAEEAEKLHLATLGWR
jgi:aryl-alcohol dehydrogenase-like predicted oxidoreductase